MVLVAQCMIFALLLVGAIGINLITMNILDCDEEAIEDGDIDFQD